MEYLKQKHIFAQKKKLKLKNNMKKELVYGHGINDYEGKTYNPLTGKSERFYKTWQVMLRHCYCDWYLKRYKSYQGSVVCEQWLSLKNFRYWFNVHYREGWYLNKTLFDRDNKVYAPYRCCFLPIEINNFLNVKNRKHGNLPTGVTLSRSSKPNNPIYLAKIDIGKKHHQIGKYHDIKEAKLAYIKAREQRAKVLAEKYKCYLEGRAYQTLMGYKEK